MTCKKQKVTIKGKSTASGKPVHFLRKGPGCATSKHGWWKSKSASGRAAQSKGLSLGRSVMKDAVKSCKSQGKLHMRPGKGNCVAQYLKRAGKGRF